MKIMRKLAAALLAAALAAALAVPSLAAFDQDTLNGIVLIRTGAPDENGVMNYWRGTGFFVGEAGQDPEYIVTNCHVVEDFILAGKAIGGGELHVLFDQDDEAEAYLVDYDYEKDIAVLKLEEPTNKRSALQMREVEDAMLGDEVEVGCGTVLNPGSVVGSHSNIYPLSSVRGFVPAGSIYKKQGEVVKKR